MKSITFIPLKNYTYFLRCLVLTLLNTNVMRPTELHADGYIHYFLSSMSLNTYLFILIPLYKTK